jgi:hypothetical protein
MDHTREGKSRILETYKALSLGILFDQCRLPIAFFTLAGDSCTIKLSYGFLHFSVWGSPFIRIKESLTSMMPVSTLEMALTFELIRSSISFELSLTWPSFVLSETAGTHKDGPTLVRYESQK